MQLPLFPFTPELRELQAERDKYRTALVAAQTRIGYGYDWRMFVAWCTRIGCSSLPASSDTLSLYLTDLLRAGRKVSTARRRYHAIAQRHRIAGYETYGRTEALDLLRGAQRLRCEKPRKMRPLAISDLHRIGQTLGDDQTALAIRDRAVILLGFASALRSASLTALTQDDTEFCEQGLILTIPREKQDQEARGRYIGIPYGKHRTSCAVQALRNWLDIRPKAPTNRLFVGLSCRHKLQPMEAKNVRTIVKKSVRRIGLDPKPYGAHSLRSGFITAAGIAGVADLLIAEQSGHRDMNVLRDYLRKIKVFERNPCSALDL